MSYTQTEYWLILKNKSGTTWKVSGNNSDSVNMFCGAELLTVVAAYPKDKHTFDEVKKEKNKLMLLGNNSTKKYINKYYLLLSIALIFSFSYIVCEVLGVFFVKLC